MTSARLAEPRIQKQTTPVNVRRRVSFLLMLSCGMLLIQSANGQSSDSAEPPAANQQVEQPANPPDPPLITDPETNEEDKEKREKVAILMGAIGGIAILGIGAIAILMIWARHIRRLARDQGAVQRTEGNDFWFLKPPKPMVSSSNVGEPAQPNPFPSDEKKPE